MAGTGHVIFFAFLKFHSAGRLQHGNVASTLAHACACKTVHLRFHPCGTAPPARLHEEVQRSSMALSSMHFYGLVSW